MIISYKEWDFKMPRAYRQDLRCWSIWLTEIMGFEIDEVSVLLQMSKRSIYRYVEKFHRLGNVETAVIGRPYSCIAMHPHEELVIMEVLYNTRTRPFLKSSKKCMRKQCQSMRVLHYTITWNATTSLEERLV